MVEYVFVYPPETDLWLHPPTTFVRPVLKCCVPGSLIFTGVQRSLHTIITRTQRRAWDKAILCHLLYTLPVCILWTTNCQHVAMDLLSATYLCKTTLIQTRDQHTFHLRDSTADVNNKVGGFLQAFVLCQQGKTCYLCKPCFSLVDKAR